MDPHPSTEVLAYLSARDALDAFDRGDLTSSSLVASLLERIAALDPEATDTSLRAIAALSPDALDVARDRDDERRRGERRGPLHGVPVVVKDNVEAAGLPGWAGSTALRGRPARDAELVGRLRSAGAIVLASTNLSEWANLRSRHSSSGWSAAGGLVANPWALDRSAGGSSSGSGAAMAAGFAPLAVGTETDGSIVCPASLNGVVGIKPTVGAVPTAHVVPISASQDSPGPLARDVADTALLFAALSGRDPEPVEPPRVAWAANWSSGHPATDTLIDDLVARLVSSGLGVERRDLAEPSDEVERDELTVLVAEFVDDLDAYLAARPGEGVRSMADVIAFEDEHRDVEQPFFGHDLLELATASGGRAGPDYADARRRNLAWALDSCLSPGLDGVDAVIAASYAPAWKTDLALGDHFAGSCVTTAPAIAGWPVACVPAGLVNGLPVGLAIVGRPGSEWTLLEVARRVEAVVSAGNPPARPTWRAPSRG